VDDDTSKELGALTGQPKRDRSAERVSNDPGGSHAQMLDESREIGSILANATLLQQL
jgi:hypothetical protein